MVVTGWCWGLQLAIDGMFIVEIGKDKIEWNGDFIHNMIMTCIGLHIYRNQPI